MTGERAAAYMRVIGIVDNASELLESERAQLRSAADALIFAIAPGVETAQGLAEARAVGHALVDSRRWSRSRADELLAAVRACGPEELRPPVGTHPDPARFTRRAPWQRARP